MHELLSLFGRIGHYNYGDYIPAKHRGKGHNRKAHKNKYKQKIKGKRGKR